MTIKNNFNLDEHYTKFLSRFNADWLTQRNSFSNPANRTYACAAMIQYLIITKKNQDAQNLFDICNSSKAWDPNIGTVSNSDIDGEYIKRLCAIQFARAQESLKQADQQNN